MKVVDAYGDEELSVVSVKRKTLSSLSSTKVTISTSIPNVWLQC